MKHRKISVFHDILGGLVVVCLIAPDLGASDWTMEEPTDDLTFETEATIAGYGDAPATPSGYVFRAYKISNGSIIQSSSGTSDNNIWNDDLMPPSSGWPAGESVMKVELRAGGDTQASATVSIEELGI